MNSRAEVSTPYVPVELIGDDKIEQVVLQHVKTEEKIIIDVDDVIVNYGFVSSLAQLKLGLRYTKNILVNSKMETNILAFTLLVTFVHMKEK